MLCRNVIRRSTMLLAAAAILAAGFGAGALTSRTGEQDPKPDWLKFCQPCVQHDILNRMAGRWHTEVRSWETPDSEPGVTEGRAVYQWNLGGRFLRGDLKAYVMGQEVEVIHYLGFDNYRGEFEDVWMDNRSNAMQRAKGRFDEEMNGIVFSGTADDFTTDRKDLPFRWIIRFVDDDTMVLESFRADPSGKLAKRAEATFTRE